MKRLAVACGFLGAMALAFLVLFPNRASAQGGCYEVTIDYYSDSSCNVNVGEYNRLCDGFEAFEGTRTAYYTIYYDCCGVGSPCPDCVPGTFVACYSSSPCAPIIGCNPL